MMRNIYIFVFGASYIRGLAVISYGLILPCQPDAALCIVMTMTSSLAAIALGIHN